MITGFDETLQVDNYYFIVRVMALLKKLNNHKRLVLVGLVIVVIAASFWGGSRYPQLDEKALMGGDTQLESPLSFDSVIQIQQGDSSFNQVIVTTINWAAENRNGMTFGILFGAAFLTLFNLLKHRGSKNGFINTLLGLGMGAPLGVCVNCAAPIAKGMHAAGARLETTLAAMFSSATLNVVILIMLFTLFPPYLAIIKLTLTLVFIILMIPLLTRTAFAEERVLTYDDSVCPMPGTISPEQGEDWKQALSAILKAYLKSLWYIIKTTLPLMVLAGLLGAVAVTFIPLDAISDIEVNFFNALLVAAIGIFLPLPIALDIVIAAALLASGLPVFYVAVLLFTLGIYSIYPFFIIWTSISKRVALVLGLVLMLMGIAGGYVAEYYHQQDLEAMYEFLEE